MKAIIKNIIRDQASIRVFYEIETVGERSLVFPSDVSKQDIRRRIREDKEPFDIEAKLEALKDLIGTEVA